MLGYSDCPFFLDRPLNASFNLCNVCPHRLTDFDCARWIIVIAPIREIGSACLHRAYKLLACWRNFLCIGCTAKGECKPESHGYADRIFRF